MPRIVAFSMAALFAGVVATSAVAGSGKAEGGQSVIKSEKGYGGGCYDGYQQSKAEKPTA